MEIIRYCKKCRTLFDNGKDCCDVCKKELSNSISNEDLVFLIKTYGLERDAIKAALKDKSIPFVEKPSEGELSLGILTSKDVSSFNLYVSYGDIDRAEEALSFIDVRENQIQKQFDNTQEMSESKRNMVKTLSIIGFFLIILVIVYGIDFIARIIKGMI